MKPFSLFKTLGFSALFVLFAFSAVVAEDVKYNDSWGKAGFTVENQNENGLTINYSVERFSIEALQVNGKSMQNLILPGSFLQNNEGAPNIPGGGRYIALPQGAKAVVNVTSSRIDKIQNVNLAPAPVIPKENEDGPAKFEKNPKIYGKDAFYPAEPVLLSDQKNIRGVDAVILGVTPFQYNPVTKELLVYRDLKVEITFEGGNGQFGEDRLRSRWWDPMMRDMFLNQTSIPEVDPKFYSPKDDQDFEYVIIVPDDPDFLAWADSIRMFRIKQGIRTGVFTTTEVGGNTTNAIESFINDAYNNWAIPPAAVLLMADYGTGNSGIISPVWSNYCVSDNIYADVDNDDLPDVVFARMTAQNATHLETMVTKFLDHERTPPTNPGYYHNPITALGWQTERWFQICSEAVGGYWKHVMGKDPVRINAIYSGNPGSVWSTNQNTSMVVDYFGPNGQGYIPATPAELGGWTGGNANDVNNAINSGAFMMQHRDHGSTSGWGEPDYQSSDINGLQNTDLTFVFSINCLTGKYNGSGECFTEKFHRYTYNGQNSGALGLNAASEVSYSFVNDTYVWGMMDNMWPDFMPTYGTTPPSRDVLPAFGSAAGKHFLQQSNWPYNTQHKDYTHHLFHHHGDAFMTVYSEVPQNLNPVHDPIILAGVDFFTVQVEDGAWIALTVGDEIIGVAESTGAPIDISITPQLPPTEVLLTITKQNYYRYTTSLSVIPPSGAYVVKDTYTINDTPGGNGDGMMDYGESILLSLTVKNVGNQQANGVDVELSTSDPYVTITDNTEYFGDIPADGTMTKDDAFAFDVANDLPDEHTVTFDVTATDGDSTWVSTIGIMGYSPMLELMEDITILDPGGNNNGKLDPGETVDMVISVENMGHSGAVNVEGILSSSDPYVTVNSGNLTYGDIAAGSTADATFSVTAEANTPAGHMADFVLDITADLGITGSGMFDVVIGQIPVLILDLDDNTSSGPQMETAIQNLGVGVEYQTSFPSDLNLYSSVFVCLGIYSDNHVLSSSEGNTLADYLNNGGYLYMEGGDTWYFDDQTAVHAMFNINATDDGSSDMSTVNGQSGTFTEGMSFSYSGENNWMDHIEPVSPAFKIFQNQSPSYGTGVAYDEGSYRTIGASHEFGGLNDGGSPSTKEELMEQYLVFFDLLSTDVQANFAADETEVCEGSSVTFTDYSTGPVTSWNWDFPGGTPSSSTDQNPTVTYNTTGDYDVTLTVSDGSNTNSMTMDDYISVMVAPGQAAAPIGESEMCQDSPDTDYTTTGATGASDYIWEIDPANAGTISGTGMTATVDWNNGFSGTAMISVCGTNICGDGPFSSELSVTIHAMPNVTMEPMDDYCLNYPSFELTGGMPEGGEYSGPGVVNGWFDPAIAGMGTHTITYTYTDNNGCENFAEETIYVDACTGISDIADDVAGIYPNPNDGTFTLSIRDNADELVSIRIISSLNEVVFEESNIRLTEDFSREIDISTFAEGVYFLQITGTDEPVVRKIVVR